MEFKYYCNISGATCNKDYKIDIYSPCCIKCPHECSNCIVKEGDDTFKCDDMITKEELITNLIRDLESEKYKALQEIKNIDKAINELEKK